MTSDTKNMTGEQIQKVLDFFLYQALEALMLRSDIFDEQIAYILSLTVTNRKRKVSAKPKDELIGMLGACLATADRRVKFDLFRECRVERSFVHGFMYKVLQEPTNATFLKLYRDFIRGNSDAKTQLDNIAYINFQCSRAEAWTIMQHLTAFMGKFFEFRTTILGNYMKMSSVQAKSFISGSPNGQYDFGDLRQSILKATLTALDKYDSSKGALTTYINWWVLNAQTSSSEHEYGVAYTIPQAHKRKIALEGSADVNFSVSLDALVGEGETTLHESVASGIEVAGEYERHSTNMRMRKLIKAVDTNGVARLYLDIGEVFTKRELRTMAKSKTVNKRHVNRRR